VIRHRREKRRTNQVCTFKIILTTTQQCQKGNKKHQNKQTKRTAINQSSPRPWNQPAREINDQTDQTDQLPKMPDQPPKPDEALVVVLALPLLVPVLELLELLLP
jgi:type IV secretory pathway VirB10-like protein